MDRAGLVPGDGETHQGIHDVPFLSEIGIPTICPCNYAELRYWLQKLVEKWSGPRAIRYARGAEPAALAGLGCTGQEFDRLLHQEGAKIALVSYGTLTEEVLKAEKILAQKGIACDVYKLTKLYPLPEGFASEVAAHSCILFAEDSIRRGGTGSYLAEDLLEIGWQGKYLYKAIDRNCLPHGTVPQLRQVLGLTGEQLAEAVEEAWR